MGGVWGVNDRRVRQAVRTDIQRPSTGGVVEPEQGELGCVRTGLAGGEQARTEEGVRAPRELR